ncbi:Minichromosome maintenance domain-containing protein 2 [Mactra antiquata]
MDNISVTDHLKKQLHDFEVILKYLDQSGNLSLVKTLCDKYKKSKNLVHIFKILIDPSDLIEASAKLGNIILQDHNSAEQLFKQVIYKVISVLELLPQIISASQLAVIIRLSTLPVLSKMNTIQSVRCMSRLYNLGIFGHITGIVTGLSSVSKYTLYTRYTCTDGYCEGYQGNHFIRIHTPGASEAQTVRCDFTCTFCGSVLKEDKSNRTLSDRIVLEMIPENIMSKVHSNNYERSGGQAIPVIVRDDLTKIVEIGESYEIIGTVRKDLHDDKITLMLELKKEISTKKLLHELPRNVLRLYKDRKSSPWSFVLTLAYMFGSDTVTPGCYFSLKLYLLLSLMSQRTTKTKPLHILSISADTELVSRLMQFSLRFKDSSTSFLTGHSLTGQVTSDKYKSFNYFIEGGLLHLSQNGVCYVGNVDRLKNSTRLQLQSALSGGKIVTDIGPKYTGGLPQHLEQPLKGQVWGYIDDIYCKKKQVRDEEEFIPGSCADVPKSFLDSFSIICYTDCGDITSNDEVNYQILQSTLETTHPSSNVDLPVSTEDFIQFLKFAIHLKPRFTKEAETLIHSYYITCRKSRSTSDGTDVPVNADQTILSLALSHAKLAIRNEVTIYDAVAAIKLYEEYLTCRFGYSMLTTQFVPHLTSGLLEQCLGPQNDELMHQFHKNLLRYCSLASGLEE